VTARPLVSIVTPTLNQGGFIEATIRSIRGQTYDHYEHIVVDGGSTDGTLDILARLDGTYPMRWLSEPDRGMYDAVNKGMRLATGDILCYLNSDDLFFPWTLETVVEAFAAHPEADFLFGDALGLSPDGREDIRFQPTFRWGFLLYASSFVQPTVFWRRSVAEEVGDFDASMRLAGDLDYWLRMGQERGFLQVHELLAIERDHVDTKRSQQWDLLIAESVQSRERAGAGSPARRRVMRTVERFRAWASKRALWLAFVRELRARRDVSPRRWPRFLATGRLHIDPLRVAAGQLPWLGRRALTGAVTSGIDWSDGRATARQRERR
jgi:glycosyltransferase involved in cell wall biosynthesis